MNVFKGKVIPIIGFLGGMFFVAAYFFGDKFLDAIPNKSELTLVSGEVEWAHRASKKGRDVRFKLKGKGTFVYNGYGGALASEIYESLSQENVMVQVLADMTDTQKPVMHEYSYNPVYEIRTNLHKIRSYEESIASESRGLFIMPWFGVFLIIASVFEYRKNRKQYWFKT